MNAIEFHCDCGRRVLINAMVLHPTGFRLLGFCSKCGSELKWDLDTLISALKEAPLAPAVQRVH